MTDTSTSDLPLLPDAPDELPPVPGQRVTLHRTVWILYVVVALLVIGTLTLWWAITRVQHDQVRDRSDARALYSQAASAGVTPVVTPAGAPSASVAVTGPAGPTGPGPSAEQVELAVASYCAVNVCGTGPSAVQVAQAVASYCDAAGQCKGPAGQSGAPGGNGAPGATGPSGPVGPAGPAGADGQSVTAQQVADAVNAYCSDHGNCAGPAGASGQPGEPPFSWTYTSALGVQHTCVRTTPFDASAPTYSCT